MFTKPYSEDTARVIDEEVSKLIESQYQRAIEVLTENKEKLTQLAEKLLTNEVIFKEDLEQIFGKRQWETEELSHPSSVSETTENQEEEKEIPEIEGDSDKSDDLIADAITDPKNSGLEDQKPEEN